MRSVCAALFVLALAAPAAAQTPVLPGNRVAWDQTAMDLAEVKTMSFLLRLDGGAPLVLAPAAVTCAAAVPAAPNKFTCSAPFPAATPGVNHTLTVAARLTFTVDGKPSTVDSAESVAFQFRFIIIAAPENVRAIGGA